jgi:hypothetical protein
MAANDRLGNLPEKLGPVAARLVDYWLSLPKTERVPMRAHLDPVAIRESSPISFCGISIAATTRRGDSSARPSANGSGAS